MPSITIQLEEKELKILEKRAKKNFFTIKEQIEDIIRRSCLRTTTSQKKFDCDDRLVGIFSRQKSGRKKKK